MSGVIRLSSTDLLKSSIKLSSKVYESEWIHACKSEGDTMCFVGTTYAHVDISPRWKFRSRTGEDPNMK